MFSQQFNSVLQLLLAAIKKMTPNKATLCNLSRSMLQQRLEFYNALISQIVIYETRYPSC